jgi:hypothetical protein
MTARFNFVFALAAYLEIQRHDFPDFPAFLKKIPAGIIVIYKKTLRGLNPQANYTDLAIAACQRS